MSRGTFNGVKVFSATMVHDRATLGEKVTEWLEQRPTFEVVEMLVTQSSDQAFHCIAITLFYRDPAHAVRVVPPVDVAPEACAHPAHRQGTQPGLRRNQRVCLNCGQVVVVRKVAS